MIFFSTFNHLVNQKITFLCTTVPIGVGIEVGGGLNFHLFCKERHKFT